jgi:hypothetical protein
MSYVSPRPTFHLVAAFACIVLAALASPAQRTKLTPGDDNQPVFSDFKGVRIGMTADEARKKLGSARTKSAEEDFYVFNDNQAVQVLYDKGGTVTAISIDFMNGADAIPAAKDVLGTEADARADGSTYKMLRYPKAGFWVSYSRTAGKEPTTTVIIQKIDH